MAKRKKKELTSSDVIRLRRIKLVQKEETKALFFRILLLAVTGWVLFTQVFLLIKVQGQDMFPALKDGDLAVIFRLQQTYRVNDVIAYEAEGSTHVGRIVACENDVVYMDDTGTLLVNDMPQSGEIMYPTYAPEGIIYPERVPVSSVYVLGDYRTQCKDSRDYGAVSMEQVKGKVITILRRRGI